MKMHSRQQQPKKQEILNELCEFIRNEPIFEFCDLDEYIRTQRKKEWRFILDKTYYFNSLIKSQRSKFRK